MIGRLRRLLSRGRLERELDAELQDHVARAAADYERAGLAPDEARRRARLDLGGVEPAKEACRDARGTRLLEDLGQDVAYGLRVLRRSPAFAAVAIASLALGIGANTAIFTLVDALVLRSLPVREPERLARLEGGSWTNPIWEEIRARQGELFASAAAYSDTRFDLAQGGEARLVEGLFASGSFFETLGVPAMLGRTLSPSDDRRGGGDEGPAAVVSYGFWQRHYGGAADAVGRTLVLNGVPFTVVGVTPPSFFGPTVGRSFDVAVAIGMVDRVQSSGGGGGSMLDGRSTWWLEILARLRPGQDLAAAERAVRAAQPRVREATVPPRWSAEMRAGYLREPFVLAPAASGFSELRGQYRRPLLVVMGVVALVLLIACANLASLQLARASARRQELGARLALGASRGRLVRQLLTESLLVALPGGLLGLGLARGASRWLVAQISGSGGGGAGAPVALDVAFHPSVLLFTAGVTIGTALLFGLAPVRDAFGLSPYDAVRQGAGAVGARASTGGRLVIAQVALSLVLVFAAGLFLRTFAGLAARDLGLDRDGILVVSLDAQRTGDGDRRALYARLEGAAAGVPGVARAAVSLVGPVSGQGWNDGIRIRGEAELAGDGRISWVNAVTPGWFGTYGTQLVAGRDFDERDRAGAPPVAVVNEAFARRFLGGKSPIGRFAQQDGLPGRTTPPLEIVGLVRDTVYRSPRDPMEPILYLAIAQLPPEDAWPFATLGVRATVSPSLLAREVAAAVGRVDPRVSMSFRPFSEQIGGAIRRERVVAGLSAFFGGLALLLASIGLYGVTAYAVARRRTEIAIRMALGAEARGVLRLVLGRALGLVATGLAIGAVASLWASRYVASLLYGLEARDVPTLLAVAAALALVCALAAFLPARRAARIDPARVLREG